MILKNISGPFIAANITICLFLLMRYLILPSGEMPRKPEQSPTINLSREERPEKSKSRENKVPPRPVQQETPPQPMLISNRGPDKPGDNVKLIPPTIQTGDEKLTFDAPADRRAIPVVKFPPQYPSGPLRRGIEGWVLLEFTITVAGTVEDLRVLDSEPPGVFNKSALSAVKRWKYRPKLDNGKPVPQYGMQELITYVIEE